MNRNPIDLNFPAVPFVALRVIKLIDDPFISLSQLEEAILADQALSARLLKMANSAFYGMRSQVKVISEAIQIVGFKTLKNLIFAVSLREVYKYFGIIEKLLWEHGVGVSLASNLIAEKVPLLKREEMTLAGLLHDVGKIILNNNFPAKYAECMNIVHKNDLPYCEVETELFGVTHLEVGAMLADKWGFSPELKTVIQRHSDFDYIKSLLDPYERYLLLGINLADCICTRLGIGYREPKPRLVRYENEVREMLNLSEETYREIIDRFICQFPDYLDGFME